MVFPFFFRRAQIQSANETETILLKGKKLTETLILLFIYIHNLHFFSLPIPTVMDEESFFFSLLFHSIYSWIEH